MRDFLGYLVLGVTAYVVIWLWKRMPANDKGSTGEGKPKRVINIADIAPSWQSGNTQTPAFVVESGTTQIPPAGTGEGDASAAGTAPEPKEGERVRPKDFGVFQNADIQSFWNKYFARTPHPFADIIQDLLREFDNPDEQATSSVVRIPNQHKEPNNDLSEELFAILKRVPLWRHSLDTAEAYISGVPEKERGTDLYYSAITACLAHDIGKLAKHMRLYYATGDHAWQSAKVINGIIGDRIREEGRAEIVKAVHNHHDKNYKNMDSFTMLVKNADYKAREMEARNASVAPAGEAAHSEEFRVPWFDAAEFVYSLRPYMNIWVNKETWSVSLLRGYVFFTPNVIYNAFCAMARAKDAPEGKLFAERTPYLERKPLLIFLADQLYKQGYLADDMIRPGFFSCPCIVTTKQYKKETRVRLMPFRADQLKILLRELETEKEGRVLDVATVELDKTAGNKAESQEDEEGSDNGMAD